MADHSFGSRSEAADYAANVRSELKVWEKEFASTHGGKKAGREDIKHNPDIGRSLYGFSRTNRFSAYTVCR